jgi:hypothetical protein
VLYDQDLVMGDAAVAAVQHSIEVDKGCDLPLPSDEDVIAAYATVTGPVNEMRLRGQFDARVWVEEFAKLYPKCDQGTMLGWFSNCLMAGYDEGVRYEARQHDKKNERL